MNETLFQLWGQESPKTECFSSSDVFRTILCYSRSQKSIERKVNSREKDKEIYF